MIKALMVGAVVAVGAGFAAKQYAAFRTDAKATPPKAPSDMEVMAALAVSGGVILFLAHKLIG